MQTVTNLDRNGDEDAVNSISGCNLQEMVAGDDARSSITESENESIEIVFDSDSQVINHPLHTEELLEEGLTTMPCK